MPKDPVPMVRLPEDPEGVLPADTLADPASIVRNDNRITVDNGGTMSKSKSTTTSASTQSGDAGEVGAEGHPTEWSPNDVIEGQLQRVPECPVCGAVGVPSGALLTHPGSEAKAEQDSSDTAST